MSNEPRSSSDYSVGVDCGGTFTDVVLVDRRTGDQWVAKTSSTPQDPSLGFIEGVRRVLALAGVAPGELMHVSHGTTVATNAILESRGAPSAMITTTGFRHVLEIGRHDIPRNANMYQWVKPRRPVPPEHIFEVDGRLDYTGAELKPLDEAAVRRAAQEIRRIGIRAVAVCLLHSYANAAQERRAKELILDVHPEAMVSLSSEVLPVYREYERSMATLLNVYVMPLVSSYVERLEERLDADGIRVPLLLMTSSGGVTGARTIRSAPILTALSGPAAGVAGAMHLSAELGMPNIIGIDIGGTSADVSLVKGGRAGLTTEGQIGDWPLTVPMLDITSIGAGGGSIARVSASGVLSVGPESAGASPGPVCYGRGGTLPTVTDAHCVLGNLTPHLLDGELALDRDAARRAIEQHVARPLGLGIEEAADGILRIVNSNMVGAIRLVSIERGLDPREFVLLPFGGAGPLHGGALARLLDITTIVVPPSPGVLSAAGLLMTDLRSEFSRTAIQRPPDYDIDEIANVFAALEQAAQTWFDVERIEPASRRIHRTIAMRYEHQGFELVVELDTAVSRAAIDAAIAAFHARHLQLYSFNQTDVPVELVTFRVEAVGTMARPPLARPRSEVDAREGPIGAQDVWFEGRFVTTPVHDRKRLRAGVKLDGPVIVQQLDTTTVVLPGQECEVHPSGSLLIRERR